MALETGASFWFILCHSCRGLQGEEAGAKDVCRCPSEQDRVKAEGEGRLGGGEGGCLATESDEGLCRSVCSVWDARCQAAAASETARRRRSESPICQVKDTAERLQSGCIPPKRRQKKKKRQRRHPDVLFADAGSGDDLAGFSKRAGRGARDKEELSSTPLIELKQRVLENTGDTVPLYPEATDPPPLPLTLGIVRAHPEAVYPVVCTPVLPNTECIFFKAPNIALRSLG